MNINTHIEICEKNKVLGLHIVTRNRLSCDYGLDKLKIIYKKEKVHGEEYCLFKYYQLLCF